MGRKRISSSRLRHGRRSKRVGPGKVFAFSGPVLLVCATQLSYVPSALPHLPAVAVFTLADSLGMSTPPPPHSVRVSKIPSFLSSEPGTQEADSTLEPADLQGSSDMCTENATKN